MLVIWGHVPYDRARRRSMSVLRWLHPTAVGGLLCLFSASSDADAVRITAGYGQGISLYSVALQLDRKKPVHEYTLWRLTVHVDLGAGQFQAHGSAPSHDTTRALAAIGKLRWERMPHPGGHPSSSLGSDSAAFRKLRSLAFAIWAGASSSRRFCGRGCVLAHAVRSNSPFPVSTFRMPD